ncbi:MarR family transcriptional regulator [Paenibacillus lycopersici]|uniref:MarR family transcriptional regulator n=1 Tax=Paenibacillus lycopersici TaxID=2704462 RepID=A0A6C0G125_9BACL|nr:MarR family transcriptional regulator [Paenibacillus lycopersici]QHT63148.1 MarR family transcriptional regulator [Paenibacillus lycopersici]
MKLDDHVGFNIARTLRNLNLLFNQEFSPYGITSEQWSLLKRLQEQEGISIKDLAHAAGKDQANVTRILDVLAKRGFVARSSNPRDKRSSLVYFTPEGKELTERLIPIDEQVHKDAVDELTPAELGAFARAIAQINRNANRHLKR